MTTLKSNEQTSPLFIERPPLFTGVQMLVSWRSGRRPSESDAALERRAPAAGRRDAQLHVDVEHHRAPPPWQLLQPKTSSARHVLHSPPPSLCVGCTEKNVGLLIFLASLCRPPDDDVAQRFLV